MRRLWASVLVGMLTVGGLWAEPPGLPVAYAAPAAPVASPATPLTGERFVLNGRLSTPVTRPVQLQSKSGKKWKKIAASKTDASGNYTLTSSTRAASITVRIVAPKTRVKAKKYKAITTKARTIRLTGAQAAQLTMPATVQLNQAVNATLTFTPIRQGRPVQLQALISGAWVTVATGQESNMGTTLIPMTATAVGTFSYRATAASWDGAPAANSAATQLTVTPDQISIPDTTRPLTAAEVASISDYSPSAGTLSLTDAPSTLSTVNPGDAITIPPRDGAPSGALRRVTAVSSSGGSTVVSTEDVSLPEVIENIPDDAATIGLSLLDSSFVPEDGVTVESQPVAPQAIRGAGVRPASVGELKLKLNAQAKASDGLFLKLNGGVSVSPVSELELNIDWFRLKSYKIGAGVQVNNDVSVEVGLTGTSKLLTKKLGVLKQIVHGSIGPVPFWMEIHLDLVAEVTASGTISVIAEVKQSGTTKAGIRSTSDFDLTPTLYTSRADSTTQLVKVNAAGSVDAFLGPQLEIMLYSMGGPYARLGAQAKAELSTSTTDGWKCILKYGPHAEVGVRTSDAMKKITGVDFKASAKLDFTLAELDRCPTDTGGGSGGDGGGGTGDALTIDTLSLPEASLAETYEASFGASGGVAPYTWTATDLPPGLALSEAGTLSGTPLVAGDYTPTFTVTDSAGTTQSAPIGLHVSAVDVDSLTIDKSAEPPSGNTAGSTILYRFDVTNSGTSYLHGLSVIDPMVSAITCPVTALAPATSVTCTALYHLTQADVQAGQVTNTAMATALSPQDATVFAAPDAVTTSIPS